MSRFKDILKFAPTKPSAEEATSTIKVALDTTRAVLAAIDQIPIAGPVLKIAVKILETIHAAEKNHEDLALLAERVSRIVVAISSSTRGTDVPDQLRKELSRLESTFRDIYIFVVKFGDRSFVSRWVKNIDDSAKIRRFKRKLDEDVEIFSMQRSIDMGIQVGKIVDAVVQSTSHSVMVATVMIPVPVVPPHFYGRTEELEGLVKVITNQHPARVCVRGTVGIGKSALAIAVMHDERIVKQFGSRRFFVRLDRAKSADDILTLVALQLGISGEGVQSRLISALSEPGDMYLITLDNIETLWDTSSRQEVEDLLGLIASVSNVAIIATIRGIESPRGLEWTPSIDPLSPFTRDAVRALFFSITNQPSVGVFKWDPLLDELGGLPLAISLLGSLALLGETADRLLVRWKKERAALLQRDGQKDRFSSLEVSIELSLTSARMTSQPNAIKLLTLLSLLPDGITEGQLDKIFDKPDFNAAASLSTLWATALVERHVVVVNEITLFRVSSPIRAYISSKTTADPGLLDLIIGHYIEAAINIADIGRGYMIFLPFISAQFSNIQDMMGMALSSPPSQQLLAAVGGLGKFTLLSSLGNHEALEKVLEWRKGLTKQDISQLPVEHLHNYASCQMVLADMQLEVSDGDSAITNFNGAIDLFVIINDQLNIAMCFNGIAKGHLTRGRDGMAEAEFFLQRAMALYDSVGDNIGVADCLQTMAQLDVMQWRRPQAIQKYNQAIEAYKLAGDKDGQYMCLNKMAIIYDKSGDSEGESTCYRRVAELLGPEGRDLAQAPKRHTTAITFR